MDERGMIRRVGLKYGRRKNTEKRTGQSESK